MRLWFFPQLILCTTPVVNPLLMAPAKSGTLTLERLQIIVFANSVFFWG